METHRIRATTSRAVPRISPESKSGRHWSKASLIWAVQNRRERGLSLHPEAMKSDHENDGSAIYWASRQKQHFGKYSALIIAAGYDYDEIRRTEAPKPGRYASFTKEQYDVIKALQSRQKAGGTVDLASVLREDKELANMGLEHFEKKWKLLIKAAGFNYDKIGILGKWPSKKLREIMKDRIDEGESTTREDVCREYGFDFLLATILRYGDWESLIGAANKALAQEKVHFSPESEDEEPSEVVVGDLPIKLPGTEDEE